jgi:NDP-sugar pyrophosphorylase family protein
MQIVMLAAGLGTRLRPVTDQRSKAMVPVLGRPLVERALMPFVENGVRDVVFVVSPEDAEIEEHFAVRSNLGITARFVAQHDRLGMGHALGLAATFVHERFAVSACDSLLDPSSVRKLIVASDETDAVLSLLDVEPELVTRSGVVEMDGDRVARIVEKPSPQEAPSHTISLPHYVFDPRLLEYLPQVQPSPRGELELQDAIQMLIGDGGNVMGVKVSERFQVSTPHDLLTLTRRLFAEPSGSQRAGAVGLSRDVAFVEPVHIEAGAIIGDGCEIGPEAFLENGARVGAGAVVRRSIVLRNATVDGGETVEDQVVV